MLAAPGGALCHRTKVMADVQVQADTASVDAERGRSGRVLFLAEGFHVWLRLPVTGEAPLLGGALARRESIHRSDLSARVGV